MIEVGEQLRAIDPAVADADGLITSVRAKLAAAQRAARLVFLCHSSGDKERVRQLFHQLMADGVDCWFDEERILPGQYWEYEIDRAISKSRFVLACRSKESVTKAGYVQKELETALDAAAMQPEGIAFLIPVRLEECEVPHGMRRWQSVDLFKEGGYERLIRGSRHNVLTVSVPPPPVFILHLKGGDVLSNLDRLYEFQRGWSRSCC